MIHLWSHRLLGHRWRYAGHRLCPGCQRMHKVWTCYCGTSREQG